MLEYMMIGYFVIAVIVFILLELGAWVGLREDPNAEVPTQIERYLGAIFWFLVIPIGFIFSRKN